MTNNDDVLESPIVEDAVPAVDGGVSTLLSLESMIKQALPQLDNLKREAKTKSEMLDDGLNGDETYKLHSDKAKEAAKVKSATKKQLMSQPALKLLAEQIKDLREQIKELQASLSDYVREYARISGSTQIESDDGEVLDIVYDAKLVKRKGIK